MIGNQKWTKARLDAQRKKIEERRAIEAAYREYFRPCRSCWYSDYRPGSHLARVQCNYICATLHTRGEIYTDEDGINRIRYNDPKECKHYKKREHPNDRYREEDGLEW